MVPWPTTKTGSRDDRMTPLEAIQQHYELTGEDEPEQLLNMMHYQTHGEYKHMMGSDICIH